MQQSALIAPAARAWLRRAAPARVLHVFDRVCNLVDETGDVLSLVTLAVGPGPLTIVVAAGEGGHKIRPYSFRDEVPAGVAVLVSPDRLRVGSLVVDTTTAAEWSPRPAWAALNYARLARHRATLTAALARRPPADLLASAGGQRPHPTVAAAQGALTAGLARDDRAAWQQGAAWLAGLGPGLTPSGDDFLLGVAYGLWALAAPTLASSWTVALAAAAAPRTTSLSAAWLAAAARGEAGAAWHDLVSALAISGSPAAVGRAATQGHSCDPTRAVPTTDGVAAALERVLATGHTSGADALHGFLWLLNQQLPVAARNEEEKSYEQRL